MQKTTKPSMEAQVLERLQRSQVKYMRLVLFATFHTLFCLGTEDTKLVVDVKAELPQVKLLKILLGGKEVIRTLLSI